MRDLDISRLLGSGKLGGKFFGYCWNGIMTSVLDTIALVYRVSICKYSLYKYMSPLMYI